MGKIPLLARTNQIGGAAKTVFNCRIEGVADHPLVALCLEVCKSFLELSDGMSGGEA
jgi:hypothetical protein